NSSGFSVPSLWLLSCDAKFALDRLMIMRRDASVNVFKNNFINNINPMTTTLIDFYRGRFSVAPMLDLTTLHCRFFHRQFSRHTLLYTEMVTAPAIIYAKYDHLLYHPQELPLAL